MPKVLGPASLYAFLEGLAEGSIGGEFYVWDLFTFTLVTGQVILLTNCNIDITTPSGSYSYSGKTYSSAGPYINRSQIKQSIGLTVDSCDITITAPPDIQFGASYFLAAVAQGQFDGATVQVDRLFQQSIGDFSIGAQPAWFKGQMAEISELGRNHCKFTVRDKKELLNIQMPRNLIQPPCFHTLGDAGCTIDLDDFTFSGTVQAGSNASIIQTDLTQPGALPAPLLYPALGAIGALSTGVNLAAPVTYYAVWTTLAAIGESPAGPESSLLVKSRAYQLVVYSTISAYSSITTYATGAIVSSGGSYYESLNGGNLNHTPASSPAWWNLLIAPPTIPAYDGSDTYAAGALVSSGGSYYESLYGANVGNTPVSSPLWWIELIGLNLYIGQSSGGEQLQNSTLPGAPNPLPFTSTYVPQPAGASGNPPPTGPVFYVEPGNGLNQGAAPPLVSSSGYFTLGTILFTSGQNQGVRANVDIYGATPGSVKVVPPLPYAPANGDTFEITAGCDRSQVRCTQMFDNVANFGGTPFVPLPSAVL